MSCPIRSFTGMCTDLHNAYKAEFPRVSDSDVESASHERGTDVANVDKQDAPPERHLTPKSLGNADVQPEQVTAKSPGNAAQPEHHLTPTSPENGDATPFGSAPELPRFSSGGNQSLVRYTDTPFKTPGGTPESRPGGTGVTMEIPATYGSYVSPGQSIRVSDPNGSPFPFDDQLEEDLPEIPGLISTPIMISSAGTGATELGSLSIRTR